MSAVIWGRSSLSSWKSSYSLTIYIPVHNLNVEVHASARLGPAQELQLWPSLGSAPFWPFYTPAEQVPTGLNCEHHHWDTLKLQVGDVHGEDLPPSCTSHRALPFSAPGRFMEGPPLSALPNCNAILNHMITYFQTHIFSLKQMAGSRTCYNLRLLQEDQSPLLEDLASGDWKWHYTPCLTYIPRMGGPQDGWISQDKHLKLTLHKTVNCLLLLIFWIPRGYVTWGYTSQIGHPIIIEYLYFSPFSILLPLLIPAQHIPS